MKLRKSRLTDDTLTEAFYDRIIENYDYGENYYIILIHASTTSRNPPTVPKCSTFRSSLRSHPLQYLPVKLSKAGLHYNAETNNIEDRIRDWLVEMPDWGFLSHSSTTAVPISTDFSTTPKTPKISAPP